MKKRIIQPICGEMIKMKKYLSIAYLSINRTEKQQFSYLQFFLCESPGSVEYLGRALCDAVPGRVTGAGVRSDLYRVTWRHLVGVIQRAG